MTLKTELTCPLGSKCEEIKNGAIHRCAWFIELAGRNPNTGEEKNERGCAMAWLPVLLVENAMQQRSTSVAVESFRNEMVSTNQTNQQIMVQMLNKPVLLNPIKKDLIDH
jgi:hypothetical protein